MYASVDLFQKNEGKTTGSYPKGVNCALPIPKILAENMANSVNTLKKNLEQVMISGYLTRGHEEMKDKPFKKKHKKFYVLRYKENEFATIYEYKDDKDFAAEKPKHTVDKVPLLRSTKLHLFDHIEIHKHKYENILCVLMRKDMALYLQADSKQIAEQWFSSLHKIIADLGHGTDVEDPDSTIHRTQSVPTPVTTKLKRNERKSSPAAMEDTFHPLKKKTIDVIDENATVDTNKKADDNEYLIPNVSQDEFESSSDSTSTSTSSSRVDPASPDCNEKNMEKCQCCNRNHVECDGPMPGYMNIHQVADLQEHRRLQLVHREALCRDRDQYMTLAEVSRKLHERALQRETEQFQTGYNPMKSPDLPQKSTSQTNISSVGVWPLISSTSMPSIPPPTPPRPKKLIMAQPNSEDEDDDLPEQPPPMRLRLRRSSSTSQLTDIGTFMEEMPSTPPRPIDLIPPSLPPRRDATIPNGSRLVMPDLPNSRSISPNSRTMDGRRVEGLKDFDSTYTHMGKGITPPNSLPLGHFLAVKPKSPLKVSPRSPTRHFFPESPPESPKPVVIQNRLRLYEHDHARKMSIPTPPSSPFLNRRKISAPQCVFQKHQSPTSSRKIYRRNCEWAAPPVSSVYTANAQLLASQRGADNSTIDVTDRPLPPRPEGMDVEKISRTMETILWEKTKEDGIPIPIRKSDLIDKLALVKFNDYIWIAGKRSSKERSALDKLHIGDHLWRINDQIVVDPKTAQDMIRTSAKEEVTLYIKRLPHAKIVTVKRSSHTREWGIKCHQNEVKCVAPSGPAFECGVTPKSSCVSNNRLCNWCITEINFNWFRLTGIGKDQINKKLAEINNLELTLTLQPSDFVSELKTRIEKLPNAHVFTLPRS